MSSSTDVSASLARAAALSCQLLSCGHGGNGSGSEGQSLDRAAGIIQRLGYVQIDTISVVKRAHHHTLWSRMEDYGPELLHLLQSRDRRVFEYWGHAASYLPISDYRFYTPQMRRFRDPMSKWARDRAEKCGHLMGPVLERIRAEGPLGSRDFESGEGRGSSQWWDWKPAKTALELLFWRGDLMITRRENFHRIYDLTERVLPPGTDTAEPGQDELGRFLVRRALEAHGIADARTISGHIDAAGSDTVLQQLKAMVDQGEVLEISVEGRPGYHVLADMAERLFALPSPGDDRVHILSPFDNLVIDRRRLQDLFGFEYALECYTPAKKRKYGYFVLPVLMGDRFVARVDAKVDRKKKVLLVRSVHFEDGCRSGDMVPLLAERLGDFCRFNGCDAIKVLETTPIGMLEPLKHAIANMMRR